MRRAPYAFFLALCLILTACDSSDADGEGGGGLGGSPTTPGGDGLEVGSGTVTVSGVVESTFSAYAFFAYDERDEEPFELVIALHDRPVRQDAEGQVIGFLIDVRDLPVGTYPIDDSADPTSVGLIYTNTVDDGIIGAAASGELVITESTDRRIAGRFTASGEALVSGEPVQPFAAEGTFTAELIRAEDIPE